MLTEYVNSFFYLALSTPLAEQTYYWPWVTKFYPNRISWQEGYLDPLGWDLLVPNIYESDGKVVWKIKNRISNEVGVFKFTYEKEEMDGSLQEKRILKCLQEMGPACVYFPFATWQDMNYPVVWEEFIDGDKFQKVDSWKELQILLPQLFVVFL